MNSSGVLLEVGSVLPVLHSGEMQSAPGAVPASPAASGNSKGVFFPVQFSLQKSLRLSSVTITCHNFTDCFMNSPWRKMKSISQPALSGGFFTSSVASSAPLSLSLFPSGKTNS